MWVLVAVVVLLAAGGGAFALVKTISKHPTAQSPGLTTRTAAPPTQPASSPPASPSASATPTPTPTPTPTTPTPTPTPSIFSIAPGVGSVPTQVDVVLDHYYEGINEHNYTEYASSEATPESESSFDSGFATTTDSGMTLTGLTDTGGGDLTAAMTFTSHQAPADSIDNSACNNWTLNLYLVPHGSGYLIVSGPSGYEPSYTDC